MTDCLTMRRTTIASFLLFLCTFSNQDALSQEWRFLPGDAFFEAELTKQVVTEMMDGKDGDAVTLRYAKPFENKNTKGYANLEIKEFSKKRRRLLASIYSRTRSWQRPVFEIISEERGERRELNGMSMMVYNRDFDYTCFTIGLRYNEAWVDEGCKFNVPRGFVDYYVTKHPLPGYVIKDWRDGPDVAALNASPPKSPNRGPAALEFVPMTIKSDETKMILFAHGSLDDFLESKQYVRVYIVDDETLSEAYYGDEGWTVKVLERSSD